MCIILNTTIDTTPTNKVIVALITAALIIDLPLKSASGPLSQSLEITYQATFALTM